MISCDQATFLSDKSQYEGLKVKDKINLHAHLMSCKPCSEYHKQNKIITDRIKKVKKFSLEHSRIDKLSEAKKLQLKREIEKFL